MPPSIHRGGAGSLGGGSDQDLLSSTGALERCFGTVRDASSAGVAGGRQHHEAVLHLAGGRPGPRGRETPRIRAGRVTSGGSRNRRSGAGGPGHHSPGRRGTSTGSLHRRGRRLGPVRCSASCSA